MDFKKFIETAQKAVHDYVLNQLEDKEVSFEVFSIWSCGNDNSFDALFRTDIGPEYYGVSYSVETEQMRLDVYDLTHIEKLM